MATNIKFKELRSLISVIDRVSICMRETLQYENFTYMEKVPDKYDEYYVYGIGRILSEFEIEGDPNKRDIEGNEINDKYFLGECIEIMLGEKPRDEFPQEGTWTEYAYVGTRYNDNEKE